MIREPAKLVTFTTTHLPPQVPLRASGRLYADASNQTLGELQNTDRGKGYVPPMQRPALTGKESWREIAARMIAFSGHGTEADREAVLTALSSSPIPVPLSLLRDMYNAGYRVIACQGGITDYLPKAKGVRAEDDSIVTDTDQGVCIPEQRLIVIATTEGTSERFASNRTVFHEFGHAEDDLGGSPSQAESFKKIFTKESTKKPWPKGHKATAKEFYAEAFDWFFTDREVMRQKDWWPNAYAYFSKKYPDPKPQPHKVHFVLGATTNVNLLGGRPFPLNVGVLAGLRSFPAGHHFVLLDVSLAATVDKVSQAGKPPSDATTAATSLAAKLRVGWGGCLRKNSSLKRTNACFAPTLAVGVYTTDVNNITNSEALGAVVEPGLMTLFRWSRFGVEPYLNGSFRFPMLNQNSTSPTLNVGAAGVIIF